MHVFFYMVGFCDSSIVADYFHLKGIEMSSYIIIDELFYMFFAFHPFLLLSLEIGRREE